MGYGFLLLFFLFIGLGAVLWQIWRADQLNVMKAFPPKQKEAKMDELAGFDSE